MIKVHFAVVAVINDIKFLKYDMTMYHICDSPRKIQANGGGH